MEIRFYRLLHPCCPPETRKARINEAGATDHRSNAYKRRKLSLTKGTDAMIELIKEARKAKLPADYVLFDSWFSSPKTLLVDQIINNGYIKLPLFLLRKSRPIDISNDKQQAHDLLLQNTNRFSGQVLLSISPVFPAASVLSFC